MECYSEQTCALAVDGELPPEEARRLREHIATCRRCRDLVDALRAESRLLSESLLELPEEAPSLPSFSPGGSSWLRGDLALLAAVLALGAMISGWFDQLSIPAALEWLNPFSLSGVSNQMFDLSYYIARGGTAMLNEYAAVVGALFLLVLLGGSVLLLGRRGRLRLPGMCLLVTLLLLSLPSFGLERRHADFVTVAANETIDDTLVGAAKTMHVDGVVNGDLIAFAETLEVRGTVKGNLVSFAKRTVVSGTVEGDIFTCTQSLVLDGQLGHSIYGWAQSFHLDNQGHVGDGIVAGAGDVTLEGEVKRSVTIFTGNADISGSIGRELTMAGGSLTLTDSARVGGNLNARIHKMNEVHIADGAHIGGKRDIQLQVRTSPYSHPRFYFHQALWLAAAILVGWLGLLLFPGFFRATTQAVGSGWMSLAIGVGVLAGLPVAMIVIGLTLVGLPISLMLLAAYLTGLYLSKIWVGAFLGRLILKPSGATKGDWVLGLLVGLLIITIVRFIPFLGGLVHFGVLCLGLGAFAAQLYRSSRPALAA